MKSKNLIYVLIIAIIACTIPSFLAAPLSIISLHKRQDKSSSISRKPVVQSKNNKLQADNKSKFDTFPMHPLHTDPDVGRDIQILQTTLGSVQDHATLDTEEIKSIRQKLAKLVSRVKNDSSKLSVNFLTSIKNLELRVNEMFTRLKIPGTTADSVREGDATQLPQTSPSQPLWITKLLSKTNAAINGLFSSKKSAPSTSTVSHVPGLPRENSASRETSEFSREDSTSSFETVDLTLDDNQLRLTIQLVTQIKKQAIEVISALPENTASAQLLKDIEILLASAANLQNLPLESTKRRPLVNTLGRVFNVLKGDTIKLKEKIATSFSGSEGSKMKKLVDRYDKIVLRLNSLFKRTPTNKDDSQVKKSWLGSMLNKKQSTDDNNEAVKPVKNSSWMPSLFAGSKSGGKTN